MCPGDWGLPEPPLGLSGQGQIHDRLQNHGTLDEAQGLCTAASGTPEPRQPSARDCPHQPQQGRDRLQRPCFSLSSRSLRQGLGSGWLSRLDNVGVLAHSHPGSRRAARGPHMPTDVKGFSGGTALGSAFWGPQTREFRQPGVWAGWGHGIGRA